MLGELTTGKRVRTGGYAFTTSLVDLNTENLACSSIA
jgi:hypothetical protein